MMESWGEKNLYFYPKIAILMNSQLISFNPYISGASKKLQPTQLSLALPYPLNFLDP